MALYESQYFRRGDARGKQTNHEAEVNHACNDSTCTSSNDTNSDVYILSSVYSASIDLAKKSIVIDSSTEVSDSSSSSSVVSPTLLSLGTHH